MRRPQGRYFPGLAVLARHRPPAGRRPGVAVPLPGGAGAGRRRRRARGDAAERPAGRGGRPEAGVRGRVRRRADHLSGRGSDSQPDSRDMRTYRLGARQAPPLGDMQAEAEGDTEDMNRERAETHLRLLAEEELRRATAQPSDRTSGSQPEDEAVRSASVTGTLAGSAAVPDAFMASRRGRSAGRLAWRCPGEPVQRTGRRARRGRGHRDSDRLARHPGHCHGDTPPARARDHPGPARCPGHRHDRRRGTPHHPGRQPGRAGTAGALAARPAMSLPGALAGSGAWLAPGCSRRSRTPARRAPLRPHSPGWHARARTSAWRRPEGDHAGGTGPAGGKLGTRSCHGFRRS